MAEDDDSQKTRGEGLVASSQEVKDEIDKEVPAEHYMAVAEDIGYVMRMRGELPPAAPGQ